MPELKMDADGSYCDLQPYHVLLNNLTWIEITILELDYIYRIFHAQCCQILNALCKPDGFIPSVNGLKYNTFLGT